MLGVIAVLKAADCSSDLQRLASFPWGLGKTQASASLPLLQKGFVLDLLAAGVGLATLYGTGPRKPWERFLHRATKLQSGPGDIPCHVLSPPSGNDGAGL